MLLLFFLNPINTKQVETGMLLTTLTSLYLFCGNNISNVLIADTRISTYQATDMCQREVPAPLSFLYHIL
jgi:hypothetical protein